MKKIDLTGKRYGYLTVIKPAESLVYPSGRKRTQYLCRCDCGNEVVLPSSNLKSGNTKSCGCKRYEMASKTQKSKRRNRYDLSGDFGIGYTKNGTEFCFDKEDYEKIKPYKWNITSGGYIGTSVGYAKNKHLLFLHRLIMDAEKGTMVDHIGGSNTKRDNRKCNLRLVTRSQNRMNTPLQKNNSSGHVGVYWIQNIQKWHALIGFEKKYINLGYYEKYEDAVKAREDAEEKYQGEYSFKRSQCDRAIEIVNAWKPPVFLSDEISGANAQISLDL